MLNNVNIIITTEEITVTLITHAEFTRVEILEIIPPDLDKVAWLQFGN